VASRRASEELVFSGEVSVNGATVLQPQTPVDPQRDEVRAHISELRVSCAVRVCESAGHVQTSSSSSARLCAFDGPSVGSWQQHGRPQSHLRWAWRKLIQVSTSTEQGRHAWQVRVRGKRVFSLPQRKHYFALNKPKGYLCSSSPGSADEGGAANLVTDLFSDWLRQVHSCRLTTAPPAHVARHSTPDFGSSSMAYTVERCNTSCVLWVFQATYLVSCCAG